MVAGLWLDRPDIFSRWVDQLHVKQPFMNDGRRVADVR